MKRTGALVKLRSLLFLVAPATLAALSSAAHAQDGATLHAEYEKQLAQQEHQADAERYRQYVAQDTQARSTRRLEINSERAALVARQVALQTANRPPVVFYKYGSNAYGATYRVPHGTYDGDGIVGYEERWEIDANGVQAATGGQYTAGVPGHASAFRGWNFEPISLLVKKFHIIGSYVSVYPDSPPTPENTSNYHTECFATVRYSYGGADDALSFTAPNEDAALCHFTFDYHTSFPNPGAVSGADACAAQVVQNCSTLPVGQQWSTSGQAALTVVSPARAEIRRSDGSQIVFEKKLPRSAMTGPFGTFYGYETINPRIFDGGYSSMTQPIDLWFPTQAIDRNGNITTYTYDANNFVTGVSDPRGRVTGYVRDPSTHAISQIVEPGPGGGSLTTQLQWGTHSWYPAYFEGTCSEPCDQSIGYCRQCPGSGISWCCPNPESYRTLDRLILPDGRSYAFQYGNWGNLTRVDTPDGAATTYQYGDRNTSFFWPGGWSADSMALETRNLLAHRLVSTTVYPQGFAQQPAYTTQYQQQDIQVLDSSSGAYCGRILWSKQIFPDGKEVREGRCAGISAPSPYPIAQEVWQAGTLLEGTYYGNIGTDGATPVGTHYYQYARLRYHDLVDVRPYKILHKRDGLTWVEERDYEVYNFAGRLIAGDGTQGLDPSSVPPGMQYVAGRTTGNLMSTRVRSPFGQLLTETATSYSHPASYLDRNLLDLPSRVEVRDASGAAITRTDYAYDGDSLQPSGRGANVRLEVGSARGNPTTITRYLSPTAGTSVSSQVKYYDTGDLYRATDARGHATVTDRDLAPCAGHPQLSQTVTNAKGHVTRTVSDCATEQVLSVTDPNGAMTCTKYDDLGRVVEVAGPGDALGSGVGVFDPACTTNDGIGPSTRLGYFPERGNNGPRSVQSIPKDGVTQLQFLDRMGREQQSCRWVDTATTDGMTSSRGSNHYACTYTTYDSMGRVAASYVAFPANPNPLAGAVPPPSGGAQQVSLYDALGRVTASTFYFPAGYHTSSSAYASSGDHFVASVIDANGNTSRSNTDVLGRVIEVDRPGCGSFCAERMTYDAAGRLFTSQDAGYHLSSFTYDGLGRMTRRQDPDRGDWSFEYDAVGNLIRKVDARNKSITMSYDELDRLQVKSPDGDETVTYYYDGAVPPQPSPVGFNCVFALTSSTRLHGIAGGAGSINIATTTGCAWNATNDAPSWITITSASSGNGNGQVTFSVAPNGGAWRSGRITIGGQRVVVQQAARFVDVDYSGRYAQYIDRISALQVTVGCQNPGDPPKYCAKEPVLRDQMAAFLLRALGTFNPPQPPSQRFQDVPSSSVFFAFVDELAKRGITVGCSSDPPLYCPSQPVLHDQMAGFVMRAIGVPTPPEPAFLRFNDVGWANVFHAAIEQMFLRGIWTSCESGPANMYCPSAVVTREQMAQILVLGFGL